MTLSQEVLFCKGIIAKYRAELLLLRKDTVQAKGRISRLEKENEKWKQKIEKLRIRNEQLRQERDKLKKEEERLKKEFEKLTKTKNRYQIALFDHGNFKHPGKSKKSKGGQKGHTDTNRERDEDYKTYGRKRIFAKTCGKCGCELRRVNSIRQKILLDIVINPEITKLIIESERQWCSPCQKEVVTKDFRSLPFTEYGINTFMMSMILRFKCHASFSNIATVLTISHGLQLSKSDVSNLLKQASKYLGKQYEKLKAAIRRGKVMYNDETGWLVHGQKAWMWIMASDEKKDAKGKILEAGMSVYVAAESRGKGIFEEMYGDSNAYSMHDGYAGYESVTGKEKAAYCWSHVLRFAFEETVKLTKEHIACQIRDRLVTLYQTIRLHADWTKEHKKEVLRKEIDSILAIVSDDQAVQNILYRLASQKEGLILALLITECGTNNLSERELRNMAIKRSISNGSDTYQGMQTTAIIGSIVQTLHRNKALPFLPTLQAYLQKGIQEKHTQFIHISYYDDY